MKTKQSSPMTRLSKFQERVLMIVDNGGKLIFDEQDSMACLVDIVDNEIKIRRDTLNLLINNGYLTFANRPTLYQRNYSVTQKGVRYLKEHFIVWKK